MGEKAETSASTVARLEHGQLSRLQVHTVRRVLQAIEAELDLGVRWRGGDLDRVTDDGHSALVAVTTRLLRRLGWVVHAEVSFSIYGERGSIDLLAWHAPTRTLLVIEVKTSLNSIEETLRRQDTKVRLSGRIVNERFGWQPAATASLLVLPDDTTSRRRVSQHAAVLDVAFPVRGRQAHGWLRAPSEAGALLVHLSLPDGRRASPRRRARRSTSRAGSARIASRPP